MISKWRMLTGITYRIKILNIIQLSVIVCCMALVVGQYEKSQVPEEILLEKPFTEQNFELFSEDKTETLRWQDTPIFHLNDDFKGLLNNNVRFETKNGISQSDGTAISRVNHDHGSQINSDLVVRKEGKFSYVSPEGQKIHTDWVADERGVQNVQFGIGTPSPSQKQRVSRKTTITTTTTAPQRQGVTGKKIVENFKESKVYKYAVRNTPPPLPIKIKV